MEFRCGDWESVERAVSCCAALFATPTRKGEVRILVIEDTSQLEPFISYHVWTGIVFAASEKGESK